MAKCSDIPLCCTLWFIYTWRPIMRGEKENIDPVLFRETWFARELNAAKTTGIIPGYIMCPTCIDKCNVVVIKTCKKDKQRTCDCDRSLPDERKEWLDETSS